MLYYSYFLLSIYRNLSAPKPAYKKKHYKKKIPKITRNNCNLISPDIPLFKNDYSKSNNNDNFKSLNEYNHDLNLKDFPFYQKDKYNEDSCPNNILVNYL